MKVSSRAETFQDVSLPIPGKNDTYTYLFVVNYILWSNLYDQPPLHDNHLSLLHICVTELKIAQKVVLYINLFQSIPFLQFFFLFSFVLDAFTIHCKTIFFTGR